MRRSFLKRGLAGGSLLLGLPGALHAAPAWQPLDFDAACRALEARLGGQIGVFALDTGSQARLAYRADQRFAMCSTFKLLLAAAVLARIDAGQLRPDQRLRYGPRDLVPHAPVTGALLEGGSQSASLTVAALCEAILVHSDNPAANLLLPLVGGPPGLTRFAREQGDVITRLDRIEPALNSNEPGDPRDCSTPEAFVGLLDRLLGSALSDELRQQLLVWMNASETGLRRLRAGAPQDWPAADKTGTGARGAVNDVAVFFPPQRAPILMAVFMSGSSQPLAALEAAHAELATRALAQLSRDGAAAVAPLTSS